MDSNFTLDLGHKSDATVRSEGGTLIAKLALSSYFSTVVTTGLSDSIAVLKTADDNKGTGTGSTETALQKRVIVDYQFNLLVGVLDGMIDNPAVTEGTKQLMRDATGLQQRVAGGRSGAHVFRFSQVSSETPPYLEAAGIDGGGVHQWKITPDVATYTNYELLDPTQVAKIELTTAHPETDYAGSHRFLSKGIWSIWSPPILFRTK
jgi:hypothetical protein